MSNTIPTTATGIERPEIRLPLLCKAIHLAALPGEEKGERFAVVWGGLKEPKGGLGYLVELTGKRTGRVLAWLKDGGQAFRATEPRREEPAANPAVSLALWEGDKHAGRVAAVTPHGGLAQVSELAVGPGNTYSFVRPTVELGMPYLRAKLEFREFLAVAFLAFVYLPERAAARAAEKGASQQDASANPAGDADAQAAPSSPSAEADAGPAASADPEPTGTMTDVLDIFRELSYPDAVDALALDVARGARFSGFERYAARILAAAGADRLRRIAAQHEVSVVRLSTTQLFWTRFNPAALDPDDVACLMALESALNRLVLVQKAFTRAAAHTRVAQEADLLARYPEELCAYQDARCVRTAARTAPELLEGEKRENPWQEMRGARAARGGEWDLRTRFVAACESLALPTRFAYAFGCDARAGAFTVRLYVPPAAAMPQEECPQDGEGWRSVADEAPFEAVAYGLRLAALAAAAAFGAGAGVVRAQVVGCADLAFERPVFSLAFDRLPFITEAVRVLAAAPQPVRSAADVRALAQSLAPAALILDLDENGALAPIAEPDPLVAPQPELWADARPLPPDLADLLCAGTVSDLDVFHGEDPLGPRVAEAVDLADADPVEAAQRLADVVDALSALEAADGDERPALYCSNAVARLTVGMLNPAPGTRYRRVLDSSYDARLYLSRLCRRNDDPEHALDYARQCVELAPTSAQGYLDHGMCLMDLHRPAEAAAGYKKALRFEASAGMYAFLYYRLAYAAWAEGDKDAALACYTLVEDDPRIGVAAREERAQLMRETARAEAPGREEIERAFARAGIALAPSDELLDFAAATAMRVMDAGFPRAAAPLVRLIAMSERGDVMSMLASSLE